MNMPIISSWSGGKDCCLALHRAMQQGYNVKFLLNLASLETKRCCFHGIESKYMQMQANAIGILLVQKELADDMNEYEKEFKSAITN